MRKDKKKAINLRLKGKSYTEINKILGISKSTLSSWLKNLALSKKARKRLRGLVAKGTIKSLIKRNQYQTILAKKRAQEIYSNAQKQIKKISKNGLFLIGTALYWAEGYKQQDNRPGRSVDFTNSDPEIIQVMMRYFREICMVPDGKFRISLMIYPHINETAVKRYWSHILRIPLSQFHKTYFGISRASYKKRPKNRLPFGTIHIKIYNTELFYAIMGWIGGITEKINQ